MAEEPTKIARFTEFETKYNTELSLMFPFKKLAETLPDHKFKYVQGPDFYYTKPGSPFLRLRISQYPMDNGAKFIQLTSKAKPDEAKNNIRRREPNLRLDGNSEEEILNFIDMMGHKFNFKIWKSCHIYELLDATIVFYTVVNKKDEERHFIEIEVKEETIHELTEEQAWGIISKYEKFLEPVGISPQKRLRLSLYDMNVEDFE